MRMPKPSNSAQEESSAARNVTGRVANDQRLLSLLEDVGYSDRSR